LLPAGVDIAHEGSTVNAPQGTDTASESASNCFGIVRFGAGTLIRCANAVDLAFFLDQDLLVLTRKRLQEDRQLSGELVEVYSADFFRHRCTNA
jgi:hypothetical protein